MKYRKIVGCEIARKRLMEHPENMLSSSKYRFDYRKLFSKLTQSIFTRKR